MWIIGMFLGMAGCGQSPSDGDAEPATTISFHVDGMMCAESCAPTVQKILAEQPGVEKAVVDYEAKEATCTIDPKTFDADAAIADLADQDFIATVE